MKILHLTICLAAALPALAQSEDPQEAIKKLPPLPFKEEAVGNFSMKGVPPVVPNVEVKGFTMGTLFTVDAAFTTQHENNPPSAPFTLVLPKGADLFVAPGGKKTGNPELVKFTTATADKQAVEILRFTNLTIPLQATPEERLKLCAYLLQKQALPGATKGYEKVMFLEIYATKIGGNDAACLHAHMLSPKTGDHFAVKLVGILHPTQPGSVLAFLMANTKLSEIKDPKDLGAKGTGVKIIHSLKFLDAGKR